MRRNGLAFVAVLTSLPLVSFADPGAPPPDRETNACRAITSKLVQSQLEIYRWAEAARESVKTESVLAGADRPAPPPEQPRPEAPPRDEPAAAKRATGDMEDAPSRRSGGAARDEGEKRGPRSHSRTNTQEQAVDEGDIVKTDGRVIYHVSCNRDREASGCRNEVRVYSSWPASETKLLSRATIPGAQAIRQIYLQPGRLAALSSENDRSRIVVLDVSNPRSLRIVRDLDVGGMLVESRMIGSRLYLATSSPGLHLPGELLRDIGLLASRGEATSAQAVIAKLAPRWAHFFDRDPGLPTVREQGASWDGPSVRPIYACSDIAMPELAGGDRLLNLVQIDLANSGEVSGTVTGAGASGFSAQGTVYASEGAFYVASDTPPNGQPWYSATSVRKFSLANGGKPKFEASGVVRGRPLNQFAFSEHQGYLRVATSDQWVTNSVYVLRQNGARMDVFGALENLAQNEQIFAVRMMGDRGYLVTFRRTDPLFTLDLSNPARPAVVGELKIEGFSNYLHPLGKNHLLAVGQDADQWGRTTGFHLQIFDVSDPRHPVRKFHEKLAAGSISESQTDHHAFMFEPETNTFSVPWKSENYWGLIAYRVDPREGFVNLGRVNHALLYKKYFAKQCARADVVECGKKNHWWTFVTRPAIAVDRIIAIEDQLYSLSPSGVMVHRAGDRLTETAAVLVSEPAWKPNQRPIASTW